MPDKKLLCRASIQICILTLAMCLGCAKQLYKVTFIKAVPSNKTKNFQKLSEVEKTIPLPNSHEATTVESGASN